jgi:hypothetical protein
LLPDLATFQQMFAAAGAMALSNPLLLNPLLLNQFLLAQHLNPNDAKPNLSQVPDAILFLKVEKLSKWQDWTNFRLMGKCFL